MKEVINLRFTVICCSSSADNKVEIGAEDVHVYVNSDGQLTLQVICPKCGFSRSFNTLKKGLWEDILFSIHKSGKKVLDEAIILPKEVLEPKNHSRLKKEEVDFFASMIHSLPKDSEYYNRELDELA